MKVCCQSSPLYIAVVEQLRDFMFNNLSLVCRCCWSCRVKSQSQRLNVMRYTEGAFWIVGTTNDSSGGSSSKYLPRSSLTAPTDPTPRQRSPSNGSLQLSPVLSKSTCTTTEPGHASSINTIHHKPGHASSINAIHHHSLDLEQESSVAVRKKEAAAGLAVRGRPSSVREAS